MKTEISKTFFFDMAHRLTFHEGACRNIHGHSYTLEIFLQGPVDSQGMILDYGDLKKLVAEKILNRLDHSLAVYEQDSLLMGRIDPSLKQIIFPFETTAEHLVQWILQELRKTEKRVVRAVLWETRNNKAECSI